MLPSPTDHETASPSNSTHVALMVEVQACLPAIDVLRRQLLDSANHVENSVVAVCANFQKMARRSREVVTNLVSLTEQNADTGAHSGIDGLIVDTQSTLTAVLSRLESLSDFSQDTATQMSEVASKTKDIEKAISEIDNIAANARVVALNGSIEAARMGHQGAAFAIVAKETNHLATLSRTVSDTARELLVRVVSLVNQTSSNLQARATEESHEVAHCRGDVQLKLGDLSTVGQSLQRAVLDARQANESLASDLGQAIGAMQFQDSTKQRVQHVVEILGEMQHKLQTILDTPAGIVVNEPTDWNQRLASCYVMADERRIHAGESASGCEQPSSDLGDNIELF